MTTVATDMRAELVELTAERDALRAQLAGDLPAATRWLQRKVWRQAAELDRLNRRVASQRFVLRTLDEPDNALRRSVAEPWCDGARTRRYRRHFWALTGCGHAGAVE